MDVQAFIFGTIGGLAIFLYGMNTMSEGLKNIGSESFKQILQSLTKNKLFAIMVGTGITCLIQSSSATSVIVVGFVNAGLLVLEQAVAVVLGADIGTTVTAWIVSTMGIGKFKITAYALPVIAVGFLINFVAKKRKTKMIGQTLLGFGILFLGLGVMSDGVKSVKESPMVTTLFMEVGTNPFIGIAIGTMFTMIIQSSSATIAIIQVLAFQGVLELEAALPLLLGANIGTTITAQLAAIGGTRGARTVAMANTLFKVFGTMLFVPLLFSGWYEKGVQLLVPSQLSDSDGSNGTIMIQIAVAHTTFIIINVLIFSTALWRLLITGADKLSFIGKREGAEERTRYLDPLLLRTPPIALEQCVRQVAYMTEQCHKNITAAFSSFIAKDVSNIGDIEKREERIDSLQTEITGFLVQLSRQELDIRESRSIPELIHCINDAERIGDHAENLIELAELLVEKKLSLSIEAKRDLHNYYDLVDRQFKAVIQALNASDYNAVVEALEIEEEINADYDVMTYNHVQRLEGDVCNVQTGVIFLDMIANLEKIGDHLTNIAERTNVKNHHSG